LNLTGTKTSMAEAVYQSSTGEEMLKIPIRMPRSASPVAHFLE